MLIKNELTYNLGDLRLDHLRVGINLTYNDKLQQELHKAIAKCRNRKITPRIKIGSDNWVINKYLYDWYSYSLSCGTGIHIGISPSVNLTGDEAKMCYKHNFSITIHGSILAHNSPKRIINELLANLERQFGCLNHGPKTYQVSNFDICRDLDIDIAPYVDLFQKEMYVTTFREKPSIIYEKRYKITALKDGKAVDDEAIDNGDYDDYEVDDVRRATSITIGEGNKKVKNKTIRTRLIIYDKDNERQGIRQYGQKYENLTRFEIRVTRERLKKFRDEHGNQILTLDEVIDNIPNIYKTFLTKIIRIPNKKYDTRYHMCNHHLWNKITDGTNNRLLGTGPSKLINNYYYDRNRENIRERISVGTYLTDSIEKIAKYGMNGIYKQLHDRVGTPEDLRKKLRMRLNMYQDVFDKRTIEDLPIDYDTSLKIVKMELEEDITHAISMPKVIRDTDAVPTYDKYPTSCNISSDTDYYKMVLGESYIESKNGEIKTNITYDFAYKKNLLSERAIDMYTEYGSNHKEDIIYIEDLNHKLRMELMKPYATNYIDPYLLEDDSFTNKVYDYELPKHPIFGDMLEEDTKNTEAEFMELIYKANALIQLAK